MPTKKIILIAVAVIALSSVSVVANSLRLKYRR